MDAQRYHGEVLPCIRNCGRRGRTVGFLGGGTYAVVGGYAAGADQSAALLELVGDEVEIVPTDDVTGEREGDTVRVTSPKPEREERSPARLLLTSADGAERRFIREQVMCDRYRGLRNTLAFFEDGVEQVVLETSERVADQAVRSESDVIRFSLDSEAFRARFERISDEPSEA